MTIFVFKCQYLRPSNSLVRRYNQFGNLTLSFALFWSLKKKINYQIFCRVTYITGCYSLTLPLSEVLHVAKSLQDIVVLALAIEPPPPPRGNFVDYDLLKLHYIRHKIKDVSPLRVAALTCNIKLYMLPPKIALSVSDNVSTLTCLYIFAC